MAVSISSREPSAEGYGLVYQFEIDSADDIAEIALKYPEARETSSALDTSTYDVWHLRPTGNGDLQWIKGGEPH